MLADLSGNKKICSSKLNSLLNKYRGWIDIVKYYSEKIVSILSPNNCLLGVCDRNYVIIHLYGSDDVLKRSKLKIGSIVAEKDWGNNCWTACINTCKPVFISKMECSLGLPEEWAGYGVPLFDAKCKIIGALGLMVPAQVAEESLLKVMLLAAEGIKRELKLSSEVADLAFQTESLLECNKSLVKAASFLSHEVKNSLSTISAYIQLLLMEERIIYDKGSKILLEIDRVNRLLNEFRTLAKPVKFNFYPYPIDELLQQTVELMYPKANISNVKIWLKMETNSRRIYVNMDRDAIEQVFINLIENAIEAMEKGGNLTIRLSKEEEPPLAVIEFNDTGPGIPEENLSKIFKPRFTTKKSGTGLGLSLCMNIIKAHGGEIEVKSTVGTGTNFIVKLPYSVEE